MKYFHSSQFLKILTSFTAFMLDRGVSLLKSLQSFTTFPDEELSQLDRLHSMTAFVDEGVWADGEDPEEVAAPGKARLLADRWELQANHNSIGPRYTRAPIYINIVN